MRTFLMITGAAFGAALALPAAAQAPTIEYRSAEVVQQTPDDAGPPAAGELPICEAGAEDNCINSWEANRTGNRPINYWPGRPASEIDEPLPVDQPEG
ncbi:hypothetical protein [Alteriqipengyuania lutimaris]|uniref:Uncharacterized protein n=1 Tax=Alteriqipengyuania lutimaris TaxID=1538146 RepID=A0A395LG55_9SPHN|nr:hypothetical protein [Alteriqipengyuania lutimaris]MBB3035216.1 hypothetical protein [Alteriqipengyuania lutimaris]RDS75818.1 hypothetical protein DL238_14100 [Alteriqipengyuania lutimaris]